ncbi:DODA-type extradiol aromatic ring-opening family dioxygenase [Xanthomonas arboricola]|uniref:DODA-type extradiol aromatic ring-opening family dioxygenase n=1 Tax=Xanthomonas arboricola TaxID=56448 RepID=UPI002803C4B6|nr:class III extradiol ring-cleavage dioxygenase [Xanthomonas arboricola]
MSSRITALSASRLCSKMTDAAADIEEFSCISSSSAHRCAICPRSWWYPHIGRPSASVSQEVPGRRPSTTSADSRRPLYALKYEPPCAPDLAADIVDLLIQAGLPATIDSQRGLDHGAWVPLRYLKPDADVPVLQVSLPRHMDAEGALRLGRTLAPLRDRGVLIVGSGSLTHNLYEFRSDVRDPEYAQEFADWIAASIARGDDAVLLHYRTQAPHTARAHPTQEHYLPLLVAVGASVPNESRSLIRGGMTYGVLSMDSFGFGLHTNAMEDAA